MMKDFAIIVLFCEIYFILIKKFIISKNKILALNFNYSLIVLLINSIKIKIKNTYY